MFSKITSRKSNLLVGAVLLSQLIALAPVSGATEEVKKDRPQIDLAFCIDTTGSMQSEIDNVKAKTKEIVAKLAGAKPSPIIRVGIVAFRDRTDNYVTKIFPFSEDIDHVVKDISSLSASGGGDAPEAVNEALHASVHNLKWNEDKKTLKLLFLIGDAGPKHYPNDFDWRTEAKTAVSNGIQINTVGCQGLEKFEVNEGTGVFKEIARLSDGKFEPLAYRTEIVDAAGKSETVISSGGSMYRLKAKGDAWKEGATALETRGAAEKMVPAKIPSPRPLAGRGGSSPGFGYASAAAGASADSSYAPSVSRRDNNLADLVLNQTRLSAQKKLNLDFKEK